MHQQHHAKCGNQAPRATASSPPVKSATFNSFNIFCQLYNKIGSIHSLDVLASDNELFGDPDHHWVVPLTIFHYTTKGKSRNWDTDHALLLTLADLFCDETPEHLRSKDGILNLAKSAKEYISEMADYSLQWSTITVADYQAALQNNPSWPTIVNPDLDSTGSTVLIDKLMEAWAFCFKHSTSDAAMKITPGILSLFFCYGRDVSKNVEVVNAISVAMGCTEKVDEDFMKSIVTNLIPIMSIDNVQSLYEDFVESVPAFICSMITEGMDKLVSGRLEHLTAVIDAKRIFTGFSWDILGLMVPNELTALKEAQRLVSKSRYFGLIRNEKAASSQNFTAFAHATKELNINVGNASNVNSNFPENSLMTSSIDRLIETYLIKLGRKLYADGAVYRSNGKNDSKVFSPLTLVLAVIIVMARHVYEYVFKAQ